MQGTSLAFGAFVHNVPVTEVDIDVEVKVKILNPGTFWRRNA